MGRILAIDYGQKRVGLAVSDPLRIIAGPLTTVDAGECLDFLERYFGENEVSDVVVGVPTQLDGTPSESMKYIEPFVGRFKKRFPQIALHRVEERGTSVEALRAMIDAGVKKKNRREKGGLIDRTAAVIILQRYMERL